MEKKSIYQAKDTANQSLEAPGAFPFTRGIHPTMYTKKVWTMRQYAGFGDAKSSNERYRYLLSQGITGLSIAFDLPTQMGYDSDHALAQGEVGRVGVAISSLEDMEIVLNQIPLDQVSTSMTINATAAILLCLYLGVAEKNGVPRNKLKGTIQNDVLKEYIARGTYIFPPSPSLKIATDLFEFCKNEVPEWNTISISGYHIREAGSTAVQEVAFTLADGLTYVQAAIDRGLKIDDFAPRLSFFFNVHNDFLEEVAKFRAARRLWAKLIEERYKPQDKKSLLLRFHAQTAGSTLIPVQIDTNVVRVTLQCLAAALGGAQSIHTNSRDEALGLPTSEAALLALRTQQVIAYESAIPSIVDPFGGSFAVESLTDSIENEARKMIETIETKGGVVKCIEEGWQQGLIQEAAYEYQMDIENKKRIVVGLNSFQQKESQLPPVLSIDPKIEKEQVQRLKAFRQNRDQKKHEEAQKELHKAATEGKNIVPAILSAVKSHSTLGEITATLEKIFGRHRP
ncbi:MAG: methylmalonyl-CoA mutase [Proteobacteria bacterium]|nr:methylmalonyl-CoA mutase [Pseudomonadota bacterium]NBY19160.1 methylmalonyl-CoA mutase [bacterium]